MSLGATLSTVVVQAIRPGSVFTKIKARQPMTRFTAILPIKRNSSNNTSFKLLFLPHLPSKVGSPFSQLRSPHIFNSFAMGIAMRVSLFVTHILKIVSDSTEFKVFGVHARLNVTNVHDNHLWGYNAIMDYPHNSMSIPRPTFMIGLAIPLRTYSSREYPTPIRLFNNLLHNAVNSWCGFRASFHNTIISRLSDAGRVLS